MSRYQTQLAALVCAALLAREARAQNAPPLAIEAAAPVPVEGATASQDKPDEFVDVPVVATGLSGGSVFIDAGSDQGLEPGDRVRFEPAGNPLAIGVVRSVSSGSSRVELESGGPVDAGDPGEVRIPRARLVALVAADQPTPLVPAHPPWTKPPDNWASDQPLLAQPTAPEERRVTRRGSTFLQYDTTFDREGADSTSSYGRLGVDVSWENLLGDGETIELDTEITARRFETDLESEDDMRLRFQRASYAVGGDRRRPTRWQAGRFLQRGFAEFGLLDGVELTRRVGTSWRIGTALGLLPEPTYDLSTGDDTQIAFFARRERATTTGTSYGIGYQKTFHNGTADRDLLAFNVDWRPSEEWSLNSSALVDFYTSNERVKDGGIELTELHLFGTWRPTTRSGLGLSHDRSRLPDIERNDYSQIPADVLRDQRFERTGLRGWTRPTDDLRLSARIDTWRNESDDGLGGEVRADWKGLPWGGANLSGTIYSNEGTFTAVKGLRLSLDQATTVGQFRFAYGIANNELSNAVVGDSVLLEQSLRASWDQSFGRTSLSLYAEQFFGDGQDATSLGFYLRRGF